jgi:hypothetical protein
MKKMIIKTLGKFIMRLLVLILLLSLAACYPVSVVSTPKPSLYFINLEKHHTMEGDMWTIQYALDGAVYLVYFNHAEEVEEYMVYLKGVGVEIK